MSDEIEIPSNDEITEADLFTWYKLKAQRAELEKAEMALRLRIFKNKFKNPVEGTNRVSLPPIQGREERYDLKAVHVIYRKLDDTLFNLNLDRMRQVGIVPEVMIKYKPELVTAEYNNLTDVQRFIFDQVLVISNGSPQMDIVTASTRRPKKAKTK